MNIFSDTHALSFERLQQLEGDDRLTYIMEQLKITDLVPAGVGFSWFRGFFNVYRAYYRASRTYHPQPYPGELILFRPEEEINAETSGRDLGWDRLVAELKVRLVPGNHSNMVSEPHVRVLAAQLRTCLDEIEVTKETPFIA
jgi:hypothetical protein